MSVAVDVIEETKRARVLLTEGRLELLDRLAEPHSAASLAKALGLPRQRINYHLRELEGERLIELVEERRRGSVVERVYRRTGISYAISTAALGVLGGSPEQVQDRFSAAYQVALASRAIRDLGVLGRGAARAKKKLPTFALDAPVRFASAEKRNAFAGELAEAVAKLVRKYHDDAAKGGRTFHFYIGAYPKPKA